MTANETQRGYGVYLSLHYSAINLKKNVYTGLQGGAYTFSDGSSNVHADYFSGWDEKHLQKVVLKPLLPLFFLSFFSSSFLYFFQPLIKFDVTIIITRCWMNAKMPDRPRCRISGVKTTCLSAICLKSSPKRSVDHFLHEARKGLEEKFPRLYAPLISSVRCLFGLFWLCFD